MNTIDAIAYSSAGVCEYGRTVTLTADQNAPACRDHANQLVNISTDDAELSLSLCRGHRIAISGLTRADELTTVTADGDGDR